MQPVSLASTAAVPGVQAPPPVFALSTGGPLVPVPERPKLTLSRMQIAVDAIESAEGRAKAVVNGVTAPFGKDGKSIGTRLLAGPLPWLAVLGLPILAAYGAYHLVSGFPCVVAMVLGAGGAFIATCCALDRTAATLKRKMARSTLEPDHLKPLTAMHAAASERVLERAAIGRVARSLLGELQDREIFRSKETIQLLETIAQDDKLGEASHRDEQERYRGVINAFREVAAWKPGRDDAATGLIEAFQKLMPEERTAIAGELLNRLFDGQVPRGDGLSYAKANELREALANP